MTTSIPFKLRLRVFSVQPLLALTEVQLVDGALLYECIDGRDHVPTEVRAVRPSTTDWNALRVVLDKARFWLWPRRWPRVHDGYVGDFAIAVEWAGRVAVSAGPIGVAAEVDDILDGVAQLIGRSAIGPLETVASLRKGTLHPTYPAKAAGAAEGVAALPEAVHRPSTSAIQPPPGRRSMVSGYAAPSPSTSAMA